jgi:hypothetical protein
MLAALNVPRPKQCTERRLANHSENGEAGAKLVNRPNRAKEWDRHRFCSGL